MKEKIQLGDLAKLCKNLEKCISAIYENLYSPHIERAAYSSTEGCRFPMKSRSLSGWREDEELVEGTEIGVSFELKEEADSLVG